LFATPAGASLLGVWQAWSLQPSLPACRSTSQLPSSWFRFPSCEDSGMHTRLRNTAAWLPIAAHVTCHEFNLHDNIKKERVVLHNLSAQKLLEAIVRGVSFCASIQTADLVRSREFTSMQRSSTIEAYLRRAGRVCALNVGIWPGNARVRRGVRPGTLSRRPKYVICAETRCTS